MPVRLTMELPQSALNRLLDGYRFGDPVLLRILEEFGVSAINPHEEQALARWENEGGR